MRLYEIAVVQYRNHYTKRGTDEMRMFEREPRIVHSPFAGERPSGMPRSTYDRMTRTPWIIEIPTARNQWRTSESYRYPTEEEAVRAFNRMMPDENEKIGYEATKSGDWVGTVEAELKHRGYEVSRSDAASTNSKYLTVTLPRGAVKIRFSDHSKGLPWGSHDRTHYGDSLDFATGVSRPQMIAKTASLLKSLDIARGQ